jgi:Zn-finger nucleic acid-binding protein
MECPKCLNKMEVIDFRGIEIDRCTDCFGMFFDHLEKEDLKMLRRAESIDIGDDFVGARFNEILDVACPKCKVKMNHVFQEEPFLVKFESCPQCHGAYFDAGEFRDYMEEEIFEEFQGLVRHIE